MAQGRAELGNIMPSLLQQQSCQGEALPGMGMLSPDAQGVN